MAAHRAAAVEASDPSRHVAGRGEHEDADAAAVVEANRDPFEELARPRESADVLGSEQVRHQMASVDSMRAPHAGPWVGIARATVGA